MTVKVRIAPSPTGSPHVGTAYIALFNYAFAKKHGGEFLLRIEDTDQTRSQKDYENQILKSLLNLGFQWDEGPFYQSTRTEIYQGEIQHLLDSGSAYKCWCTTERLQQLRDTQTQQQQAGEKVFRGYDKHCLNLSESEKKTLENNDVPYVIRFNIPNTGKTSFDDYVRGKISWENNELDDKILLKSDGFPTYHLASVVDDHLMGITHVIRAEEWIPSTPLHVLLYQAFGWDPPVFCHMPLLRNPDGSKISKRKNPVSLDYYNSIGILPEALLNFLALQGYSMPEEFLDEGSEYFNLDTFINTFDLSRVKPKGPIFDINKIRALNSTHIKKLSSGEFQTKILDFTKQWLDRVGDLLQPRMNLLSDWSLDTGFYSAWEVPISIESFAKVQKRINLQQLAEALTIFTQKLQQISSWNAENIDSIAQEIQNLNGWVARKDKTAFMQGIRIAVCGRSATPGLGETLAAMNPFSVTSRLQTAINIINE